eukprot:CCRYP_019608-RC/>CCRYP_019608-RC protein AED:0.47 eAED:0.47 QI:0/-1/0/1/-1/0/1/0/23
MFASPSMSGNQKSPPPNTASCPR